VLQAPDFLALQVHVAHGSVVFRRCKPAESSFRRPARAPLQKIRWREKVEDTLSGDGRISSSVKKSFAAVAHSLLTSTASADQDSSAQAPRTCDLFSSLSFPR
jgi:hypothetical protein